MPKRMTSQQINQLDDTEYYPAYFYNAVVQLGRPNAALLDFDRGIIDPDEVIFLGIYRPFEKRPFGTKARMRIRGRELKRIFTEGRQPTRFTGKLERIAR